MGNHSFSSSSSPPPAVKKKQPPSSATPSRSSSSTSNHLQDQPHPRKSYHIARDLAPPQHLPSPPRRSTRQRRGPRRAGTTAARPLGSSPPPSPPAAAAAPPPRSTRSGPGPTRARPRVLHFASVRQLRRLRLGGAAPSIRCSAPAEPRRAGQQRGRRAPVVRSNGVLQGKSPDGCESVSTEIELPPILTKPVNFSDMVENLKNRETHEPTKSRTTSQLSVRVVKAEQITVQEHGGKPKRSFAVSSPGVKLRINSPRLASTKRAQSQSQSSHHPRPGGRKSASSPSPSAGRRRRSVSDSFAVMKASVDPQRDFRDSMMEMIAENDIRTSKDLEELLACYLSLNSDEYHDLIIKVFKQIWFDLNCTRLK
ncbi:hypothetical protein BT93_K1620 [Corymbia citriodora subsp. variegata]|nr:hypothetical protein BT93_K1620 [Corymbia citriodora subsp. variegata]